MTLQSLNQSVLKHSRTIELIAVIMRIISFSLLSWFAQYSPLLFIWIFNTLDAIMLSWCAILKKDRAYTLLNVFWVLIGILGIYRAYTLAPIQH